MSPPAQKWTFCPTQALRERARTPRPTHPRTAGLGYTPLSFKIHTASKSIPKRLFQICTLTNRHVSYFGIWHEKAPKASRRCFQTCCPVEIWPRQSRLVMPDLSGENEARQIRQNSAKTYDVMHEKMICRWIPSKSNCFDHLWLSEIAWRSRSFGSFSRTHVETSIQ